MSALKAVAFDFDGVLFESVDVKTEAFRQLFSSEKPSHVKEIVDYHVQNGGVSRFEKFRVIYRDILRRPLSKTQFDELGLRFARLVVEGVIASPWVGGAKEFLERNAKNTLFFVVSGTPDSEIKDIVRRKGIEPIFQKVLGSPREKAVLLREIMGEFFLSASEMAFVGDSGTDWEAARELGLPFIFRRSNPDVAVPADFRGQSIPSLVGLEECLAKAVTGGGLR